MKRNDNYVLAILGFSFKSNMTSFSANYLKTSFSQSLELLQFRIQVSALAWVSTLNVVRMGDLYVGILASSSSK